MDIAISSAGERANSSQVFATPVGPGGNTVHVAVNFLTDLHTISPYVYSEAYPKNAAVVTDSGLSVVRWGATRLRLTIGKRRRTMPTITISSKTKRGRPRDDLSFTRTSESH